MPLSGAANVLISNPDLVTRHQSHTVNAHRHDSRTTARPVVTALLALVLCTSFVSSPCRASETAPQSGQQYTFAVFPYLSAKQLAESYGPVAAEFRQVLDRDVAFKSSTGYEEFSAELAEEQFDIAMIQPFDYVNAVDHHNYLPLARVDADLRAHFVVKADSQLSGIQDLRGGRLALPSETAALSRVSLKALRSAGLEVGEDVEIRHFKSFGSCMQDVLIGQSSACATGIAAQKIFEQRMGVQLKMIYSTQPIPHMAFVVHSRLPEQDRALLQATIIGWKHSAHGKSIIEATRLPGFREVNDNDYDVIRNFDK